MKNSKKAKKIGLFQLVMLGLGSLIGQVGYLVLGKLLKLQVQPLSYPG